MAAPIKTTRHNLLILTVLRAGFEVFASGKPYVDHDSDTCRAQAKTLEAAVAQRQPWLVAGAMLRQLHQGTTVRGLAPCTMVRCRVWSSNKGWRSQSGLPIKPSSRSAWTR